MGETSPTLLAFYKLDSIRFEGGAEAQRCLPSDASMFDAKLNLRGPIEQVQATVMQDLKAISSTSAAIGDRASTRIELAAVSQELYDIIIYQSFEASSVSAILLQCKWSDDPEQIDNQRMAWLRQGALQLVLI